MQVANVDHLNFEMAKNVRKTIFKICKDSST